MSHNDTQVAWSLDDKGPVEIGKKNQWEFDGYDKKRRAKWKPRIAGAEKAGRNKTHYCCCQLCVPLKVNQGKVNQWSFSTVTAGTNLSSCDLLPMITEFGNSTGEGAKHRKAKEILTHFLESKDARSKFDVNKVHPDGYQIPGESVQPDITIEHNDNSWTYVEIVDTHAPHQNPIAWMFYETRQAQLVVIDVDDDRGWNYDKHLIEKLLIDKFERYFNDPVRTNAPKTWDERVQRHIPIAGLISKWVGEHLQEEGRLASELADARTEAEDEIETIRKIMSEMGNNLSNEQKDKIMSEITNLETAVKGDDQKEIAAKTNALKDSRDKLVETIKRADLIRQIKEIAWDVPHTLDGWQIDRLEKAYAQYKAEQVKWKKDSLPLSEALVEVFESEDFLDGVSYEENGRLLIPDPEALKLLMEAHYQGLSGSLRDGRIAKHNPNARNHYDMKDLKESVLNNLTYVGWNSRKEKYENCLNSVIRDFDDSSLDAIQVMRNALKFLDPPEWRFGDSSDPQGPTIFMRPKTDDRFGFFWDEAVMDGDNLVRSKLSELYDKDKEAWIEKNPGYSKTYDEEYLPKMERELKDAIKEERKIAKWAKRSHWRADARKWDKAGLAIQQIEQDMKMDVYYYVRNQIDSEFSQISDHVISSIGSNWNEPDTIE